MTDSEKWINGEISMGKLIHSSGLGGSFSQASDLVGGIANAYNERIRSVINRLDKEAVKAKAELEFSIKDKKMEDAAADAARMRVMIEAISFIRMELGMVL